MLIVYELQKKEEQGCANLEDFLQKKSSQFYTHANINKNVCKSKEVANILKCDT